MRRLYFGGSFNPVHFGHLICSRAVAEKAGFDRLILVPTAQPPHKPGSANMASAEHRLAMLRLSVAGDPLFEIDEIELARGGASYTIDTIRQLKARGEATVHWLIGADMLLYLPHWREPLALMSEVHFVVMARPGWSLEGQALPDPFAKLLSNVVQAPRIDISATEIRRRVAAGQSIRYLTPPDVCRYIETHGLYR